MIRANYLFSSTIIATVGRPTLTRAVESVLNQKLAATVEVIVVNDSGRPLPPAAWQQSDRVQLIDTNGRERSVARNTGAAVARGHYLHFLDDDDWLMPGALQCFWTLAQVSDAAWLYGSSQLVDRQGVPLIQLHHELNGNCFLQTLAGEWVPLQASLINARTFFDIGGFNPLITGPEDIDLLRRIALRSSLAGTPAIIAGISWGEAGSTTDYGRHPEYSRWAREQILNMPCVFERMRASASSSYWHGRIVRAYLTSTVWNLRRRRLAASCSRLTAALVALLLAGSHILSPDFWYAVTHPYRSESFLRGLRQAGVTA